VLGFRLCHHRRTIEDVTEKVLDDHVRISVFDELGSLGQRLSRGLHDDPDGAYPPPRIHMERHGLATT
jgi:hypothetical protein